jgi:hypothetical protein
MQSAVIMNKKPLANCPGCKLLVKKLEDDFEIKIQPSGLPQLINSITREDNDLRLQLSKVRHNYTVMDAQNTKETVLLNLEVEQAESELESLLAELRQALDQQETGD